MKALKRCLRNPLVHVASALLALLMSWAASPAKFLVALAVIEASICFFYVQAARQEARQHQDKQQPIVATSSRRITGEERQAMILNTAKFLDNELGVLSPGPPRLMELSAILVDAHLSELAVGVTGPIRS